MRQRDPLSDFVKLDRAAILSRYGELKRHGLSDSVLAGRLEISMRTLYAIKREARTRGDREAQRIATPERCETEQTRGR